MSVISNYVFHVFRIRICFLIYFPYLFAIEFEFTFLHTFSRRDVHEELLHKVLFMILRMLSAQQIFPKICKGFANKVQTWTLPLSIRPNYSNCRPLVSYFTQCFLANSRTHFILIQGFKAVTSDVGFLHLFSLTAFWRKPPAEFSYSANSWRTDADMKGRLTTLLNSPHFSVCLSG